MIRLLRADYLLPLILLVGILQYAAVAVGVILSGETSLWQLDSEVTAGAGLWRYLKDFFVAFLSIAWVVALPKLGLPKGIFRIVKKYYLWLSVVVSIGLLGFIIDYSSDLFLYSGLRWILLLHAAFGVFILSYSLVTLPNRHRLVFRLLWVFLLLDAYAVLLQLNIASNLLNASLGAARLTGLFSNAGAAAFFAISVALFSFNLDGIILKYRLALTMFCIFIALSSGARFAVAATFLLLLVQLWEFAERRGGKSKLAVKLTLVPIFIFSLIFGYQALMQQVDRGDAISQQFEKGGRVSTLLESIDMLASSDLIDLMIGKGLGHGTNTAYTALYSEGSVPEQYKFNILTDNFFLPTIFQFGVLGSLLFWAGMMRFILLVKPKYSRVARYRYLGTILVILLSFVAGSPFEHYYLMMSYAVSLGAVYWSDRILCKSDLVH